MKRIWASIFISALGLLSAEAAAGLLLYTTGGSSYVNALQYETFTSPAAHLSYVTVKSGERIQIQSAGIIANIPLPSAQTEVSSEDAQALIAQSEMLAKKYPQYARLLQSVGNLWKRSLEEIVARAAAEAEKKAEEDRIAAEKQKQEEDRLAKEAETARLAQVAKEQEEKKDEEERLARIEEAEKVKLAEMQRLAEVEQARIKQEAEQHRLAQIEAEKHRKEEEIKKKAEEQRLAEEEIQRKKSELEAITQKILQQDASDRINAFIQFGVGALVLFAGIGLANIAILRFFDLCSILRKRWRAIGRAKEPVTEAQGPGASRRERTILAAGITISAAGFACLVLPVVWLPSLFWLLSPILIATSVILFHMRQRPPGPQPSGAARRFFRCGWGVFLYTSLGVSVGAASLIVLALGGSGPQFMRNGLKSVDITEPAFISGVAEFSDSGVSIPTSQPLAPPEKKYVEEIASLLIAKNRLWVITQMKVQQAGSAGAFAETLSRAADRFNYWKAKVGSIEMKESDSLDALAESLGKTAEIVKMMVNEAEARTENTLPQFNKVFATAMQKHSSDAGVQKSVKIFNETLNPGGSLSELADAMKNLCDVMSNPEYAGQVPAAMEIAEKALARIEASIQLSPAFRDLLDKGLNRKIDFKPERSSQSGPFGTSITVIGEQSAAAKESIAACNHILRLLNSVPEYALIQGQSILDSTDAPASEKTSTVSRLFGERSYLPKLGDSLDEIAARFQTNIVRKSNHSYVIDPNPFHGFEFCSFLAVGRGGEVEAVIVYPPNTSGDQRIDLRPLVDEVVAQHPELTFSKKVSQPNLEVWGTPDDQVVILLKKYDSVEIGGKTIVGGNVLAFGHGPSMQAVVDNGYIDRIPPSGGRNK